MNNIVSKISEKTGIPSEVISSQPKIEITGAKSLYIENHKGIKLITPESIIIKFSSGTMTAEGKKIAIAEMTREYILVKGNFSSFKFDKILE